MGSDRDVCKRGGFRLKRLFRREPVTAAHRPVRWHAPESQPLHLGIRKPERVADSRAVIAGFGLLVLLGVGCAAAIVIDQSATPDADGTRFAEPAKKPVEATGFTAKTSSAQVAQKAADAPVDAAPATVTAAAARQAVAAAADSSQPAAVKPALATALPAAALAAVRPVKVKSISLSLKHDDPRWARAGGADADPATTDGAGGKGADLTAFADGDEVPATAALERFAGDETETAAIGDAAAPDAAPLPTARPDDVTGGGDPASADAAKAADAADAPGRPARIRTAVNLRARPADEASVLTVVPANTRVDLIGCKSWCEIVVGNRRGFVYKSFVR